MFRSLLIAATSQAVWPSTSGVGVLAGGRLGELVQLREVDHDRIGVRTGDNPDGRALSGCVDLLMHSVGGNENEVSRTRLSNMLQTITPPIPGGAFQHVQDCLLIPVVVCTGRSAGQHRAEEGAQHLGVGVAAVEGDLPEQSRGLRSVIGELVTSNDADRRLVHRCFLICPWPSGRALSAATSSPNGSG